MNTSRMLTRSPFLLLVVLAAACGGGAAGGSAASPTPGPSQTPTPGGTPNPSSTCRDFQISSGVDGSGAMNSVYYATALGGSDLSEFLGAGGWNAPTALTLCAAPANGNKSAVTLQSDVVVAISLPQNSCLCRKYIASGSTGTLYHGPDSDKLDVTVTLDSHGSSAGAPPVESDGAGSVTQAGDLKIDFQAQDGEISAGASACTASACASAVGSFPVHDLWYTTGTAISQVANPKQGGTVSVTVSGTPFGADFSDTSVKGTLAGAGEQSEDNASAGGDVATIERIAE